MKANVHELIVFLISISACSLRKCQQMEECKIGSRTTQIRASRSYNIAIKKRFLRQSSISRQQAHSAKRVSRNDIATRSADAGIHSSNDQSVSFDKTVFEP